MTEKEAVEQDKAAETFAHFELGRNVTERELMTDFEQKIFRAGWEAAKKFLKGKE